MTKNPDNMAAFCQGGLFEVYVDGLVKLGRRIFLGVKRNLNQSLK